MSHAPERVELFVCRECQAVYAGTVVKTDTGHHFEAPTLCAACDGDDFVAIEKWTHFAPAGDD